MLVDGKHQKCLHISLVLTKYLEEINIFHFDFNRRENKTTELKTKDRIFILHQLAIELGTKREKHKSSIILTK